MINHPVDAPPLYDHDIVVSQSALLACPATHPLASGIPQTATTHASMCLLQLCSSTALKCLQFSECDVPAQLVHLCMQHMWLIRVE